MHHNRIIGQCYPTQQRQQSQCNARSDELLLATQNNLWIPIKWCTGKDSNLRTSLGGTDLQSVGFNHSPTCALAVSDEQRALSNHFAARSWLIAHGSKLFQTRRNNPFKTCALPLGDQKMRERISPRQQLIWKIPLWSADGKAVRRPPCQPLPGVLLRLSIRNPSSAIPGSCDLSQDFGSGLPLRPSPQTTSIWSWRRDLNP